MSCVPVRGCRIGEGRPKVILPIVERTEADRKSTRLNSSHSV